MALKTEHVKRYKDFLVLLAKYGRSDVVREMGAEEALLDQGLPEAGSAEAEELAADLERLGPTFIKLGQLLSTRADLLPLPYLDSLSRLQDAVEPFPYEEVERIVSEELGVRISKAFSEFERRPLASASLAQVHRAALRDGRAVAVKVQRPGIREQVAEDLEVFAEIASFLDRHTELGRLYKFQTFVEEFRKSLVRELDYVREANYLAALGDNLAEFERIVVPRPIFDYTTGRVLTMEFIEGAKIDALSAVVRIDVPGAELADELFRAYLKQILIDGLFHADPHPGNIFLTPDHRVALLDLGMVGHLSPDLQERLLKLLLAVSEGRGDDAAGLMLGLSEKRQDFDAARFSRQIADLVAQHRETALEEIKLGRVVMQLSRAATDAGVTPPPELTLLGKTLLNLDQIGRTLDPDFDPNAAIRRHSADLMRQRMWRAASPANLFSSLIETKEFFEQLPGRVNRILERLADDEMELHLRGFDAGRLVEGLQKVANRISAGLIVASLIVGAALLTQIDTDFTVFGYPGLAILFFLAAAAVGLWMLWDILMHDRE